MFDLRYTTPNSWAAQALTDLDAFLIDHAACERKASATGMLFVVRYSDRPKLIEPMIAFALEELEHFHQVYKIIEKRGLRLQPDEPDPYINGLMKFARHGRDERLLDRLLVAGVVEARGCERFSLVQQQLDDPELKEFYAEIVRSESRHHALFLRLARHYFEEDAIQARLSELLDFEATLVASLPLRNALH